MEIKEQSGLRAVLQDVEIPQVYVVRQHFERDGIPDIPAYLHEKLNRGDLKSRIRPGMKVVLTGSLASQENREAVLRAGGKVGKEVTARTAYVAIPAPGETVLPGRDGGPDILPQGAFYRLLNQSFPGEPCKAE